MENLKKETPSNLSLKRLEAILGEKNYASFAYTPTSQEKYSLYITRNPKGGVVVEFLEPGNIHNIFFVDETGIKTEKKRVIFAQEARRDDDDEEVAETKEEELNPGANLDEILKNFEL